MKGNQKQNNYKNANLKWNIALLITSTEEEKKNSHESEISWCREAFDIRIIIESFVFFIKFGKKYIYSAIIFFYSQTQNNLMLMCRVYSRACQLDLIFIINKIELSLLLLALCLLLIRVKFKFIRLRLSLKKCLTDCILMCCNSKIANSQQWR